MPLQTFSLIKLLKVWWPKILEHVQTKHTLQYTSKQNETNCRIETKWTIEAVVKTKLQIVNYYNYM